MIQKLSLGASLAGLLLTANAHAAVIESNAQGFAIEETAHVAANPDKVYAALLHPELWWNSQHTFSGKASNLSLDAKAGGCLCESLPDGGSVQHLTVAAVMPGKAIVFRGAMGPFQSQGMDGALAITLKPGDGGTDLVLENNLGGFIKGGMGKWPEAADGMLTDLVAHLKYYAENGKIMPVPPSK
jgi:uncharacterized protein YndB with AHSA1/START domain